GRLVPDPARRVLVDDAAAERAPEVDRLAAPDHCVREGERLGAREALEVDGHAERRELVVRHLVARVREHQLDDLLRLELLPVALALDELRGADQRGCSATNTAWRVVARNGSVSSGTPGARCARSIVDATNSRSDSVFGKTRVASTSRRSTRPNRSPRSAAPFPWLNVSGARGS